jgi:hypothetical protein
MIGPRRKPGQLAEQRQLAIDRTIVAGAPGVHRAVDARRGVGQRLVGDDR